MTGDFIVNEYKTIARHNKRRMEIFCVWFDGNHHNCDNNRGAYLLPSSVTKVPMDWTLFSMRDNASFIIMSRSDWNVKINSKQSEQSVEQWTQSFTLSVRFWISNGFQRFVWRKEKKGKKREENYTKRHCIWNEIVSLLIELIRLYCLASFVYTRNTVSDGENEITENQSHLLNKMCRRIVVVFVDVPFSFLGRLRRRRPCRWQYVCHTVCVSFVAFLSSLPLLLTAISWLQAPPATSEDEEKKIDFPLDVRKNESVSDNENDDVRLCCRRRHAFRYAKMVMQQWLGSWARGVTLHSGAKIWIVDCTDCAPLSPAHTSRSNHFYDFMTCRRMN